MDSFKLRGQWSKPHLNRIDEARQVGAAAVQLCPIVLANDHGLGVVGRDFLLFRHPDKKGPPGLAPASTAQTFCITHRGLFSG